MNNLTYKNIISEDNKDNQLPYGERDLKYSNSMGINSLNLNNSFQQLRDNDLFVQDNLNQLSGGQIGPKNYDSQVDDFFDGYKYWYGTDASEPLSILHKINEKPENTIEINIAGDVHYLIKFSGYFFIGIRDEQGEEHIRFSTNGIDWGDD